MTSEGGFQSFARCLVPWNRGAGCRCILFCSLFCQGEGQLFKFHPARIKARHLHKEKRGTQGHKSTNPRMTPSHRRETNSQIRRATLNPLQEAADTLPNLFWSWNGRGEV
ncbi:hypothetical protein BJY01DRAFT_60118 [Aspergillus pseudoustus]|uniref:Secreted protein n=1 Tax=Aspergillus pseudoustus TaxID=1810923 RepID=A0ABR4J824_9EURO